MYNMKLAKQSSRLPPWEPPVTLAERHRLVFPDKAVVLRHSLAPASGLRHSLTAAPELRHHLQQHRAPHLERQGGCLACLDHSTAESPSQVCQHMPAASQALVGQTPSLPADWSLVAELPCTRVANLQHDSKHSDILGSRQACERYHSDMGTGMM